MIHTYKGMDTRTAHTLRSACQKVILMPSPTIRTVAQLLGLMTSSFPGVMYGPLHYRRLDMEKTRALSQSRDFESTMEISSLALQDIKWWIDNIHSSYYVISHGDPQVTLYTDASTTGWGCDFQGTPPGGSWSSAEEKIILIIWRCWLLK